MQLENDADCNLPWTPWVITIVIALGGILVVVAEFDPFGNALECRLTGWVCVFAGVIAIPIHLVQRKNRCRTILTDEGAEFLPSSLYGKYSFSWEEIQEWSSVTLRGGDGENAWSENVFELVFHDGKSLQIPQKHFHPALTTALENRVNPMRHQYRDV